MRRAARVTRKGEREDRMADLRVRSEIAGSVWKIEVAVGDTVERDIRIVEGAE